MSAKTQVVHGGAMGAAAFIVTSDVSVIQQTAAAMCMGLSCPPETQFLLYRRTTEGPSLLPGRFDCVHLKIELPSATAAKILAGHPFSEARWAAKVSQVQDVSDWREWSPSEAKTFRSSQIVLPEGEFLNLLVDEDSFEKVIVYLEWFQT